MRSVGEVAQYLTCEDTGAGHAETEPTADRAARTGTWGNLGDFDSQCCSPIPQHWGTKETLHVTWCDHRSSACWGQAGIWSGLEHSWNCLSTMVSSFIK